jgi:hypothetical protein
MISILVDFNDLREPDQLRSLTRYADATEAELLEGTVVRLSDSEGNAALGTISHRVGEVLTICVDWSTWIASSAYEALAVVLEPATYQSVEQALVRGFRSNEGGRTEFAIPEPSVTPMVTSGTIRVQLTPNWQEVSASNALIVAGMLRA